MFRYKFYLKKPNQVAFGDLKNYGTYPFTGFSDKMPLNEELDSGAFTILSHEERGLPKFSIFKMQVFENDNVSPFMEKLYYIGRDEVSIQSKFFGSNKVYEHQLTVIELTKKLEKYVCEFYCFTQSYDENTIFYTLNDAINRVMRISPIGEDDITNTWDYGDPYSDLPIPSDRAFDLIDTKITDIGDFEIPQLFLDQGTLREKLDAILKTINGIARLDTYTENNQIKVKKLSVDLFNELKVILENLKIDNINDEMGIEEFNSNLETFLDNSVNEKSSKSSTITYPNVLRRITNSSFVNAYDKVKNDLNNYLVSDDSCKIITEYPIYSIQHLYITGSSDDNDWNNIIKLTWTYNGVSYHIDFQHIDIAPRLFERSVYNSFPYTNNPEQFTYSESYGNYKDNTIYYTYRTDEINLSDKTKAVIFYYSNFESALLYCCAKEMLDQIASGTFNSGTSIDVKVDDVTIGSISNINLTNMTCVCTVRSNFEPDNYAYRIVYTPIFDTHFSTDKSSTSEVNVNTTVLENQSSRIMSFENYSQRLLSNTQRIGTPTREIAIRHVTASDLLVNGDYFHDTNEIITEHEYIYHNNFIIGKYVLSKDYNRINEYIGINSEIRQWQVPDNAYDRKIIIKNYLEVDSTSQDNTSYLTELGCKTILDNLIRGGYVYTQPVYKAETCFYTTRDERVLDEWKKISNTVGVANSCDSLMLGCTLNGGGNVLSLGFKFFDNMSSLPIIEKVTKNLATKVLIHKVPYCIPNGTYMGFLRNFQLKISNKLAKIANRDKVLPLCHKVNVVDPNYPDANEKNDLLVSTPDLLVLKDPAEILNVNYQVSIVSNNDYITIGKWFAIDNTMIKDYGSDTPLNLHIFTSNKLHGKTFNDRVNADYVDTNYPISNYFTANCNSQDYDYTQTPNFNMTENGVALHLLFRDRSIQEIVFADPTTKKIHLVIDKRYFGVTYDGLGNVVLERNTIYFNFTKKRSNLSYDY